MSLKDSMSKWLSSNKIDINPDLIRKTCNAIGVTGEKMDACVLLATEYEQGDIDDAHFLTWMGDLCGKKPEEVDDLLRSNSNQPKLSSQKILRYRIYLGEELDNSLWSMVHNPQPLEEYKFGITIKDSPILYVPNNQDDDRWVDILKKLENQQ
ncbi:MAG: hypothetical protein WCY09_09790 [Candidatus Omnitrophota bacterium]|jgi:hypothetical protein